MAPSAVTPGEFLGQTVFSKESHGQPSRLPSPSAICPCRSPRRRGLWHPPWESGQTLWLPWPVDQGTSEVVLILGEALSRPCDYPDGEEPRPHGEVWRLRHGGERQRNRDIEREGEGERERKGETREKRYARQVIKKLSWKWTLQLLPRGLEHCLTVLSDFQTHKGLN